MYVSGQNVATRRNIISPEILLVHETNTRKVWTRGSQAEQGSRENQGQSDVQVTAMITTVPGPTEHSLAKRAPLERDSFLRIEKTSENDNTL